MKEYRCCLCGRSFWGYGNNPWPLDNSKGARCCDDCNDFRVIPARIELMFNKEKNKHD